MIWICSQFNCKSTRAFDEVGSIQFNPAKHIFRLLTPSSFVWWFCYHLTPARVWDLAFGGSLILPQKSPRKTQFSTQCYHESGLAAWFLLPFCTKGMKSLSSSGLTDEIFFQRRDIFRKNFLGQKSLVRLTNFLSRQKSGLTLARVLSANKTITQKKME